MNLLESADFIAPSHAATKTPGSLEALCFDNRYTDELPGDPDTQNRRRQVLGACYSLVKPTPVAAPKLVAYSREVADLLGLSAKTCQSDTFAQVFTGNHLLPGMQPYAMCYGGHQFGNWAGQLGDGRAILLGEVRNSRGEKWDLQLKGSGLTPFSRDGDGRAVLRSTVREYLCGEAMHGLGIPSTRSLCLFGSQEEVYRERIESGAMLLRMAPSHVRFGSFEVFYYRSQFDRLQRLADYVIEHHYSDLRGCAEPYLELLRQVVRRTARLIAQWQLAGFAHGVMNTDNMSVLGLTLDYRTGDIGQPPNTLNGGATDFLGNSEPKYRRIEDYEIFSPDGKRDLKAEFV